MVGSVLVATPGLVRSTCIELLLLIIPQHHIHIRLRLRLRLGLRLRLRLRLELRLGLRLRHKQLGIMIRLNVGFQLRRFRLMDGVTRESGLRVEGLGVKGLKGCDRILQL